jgi:uncharacterized protein YbcI
MFTGTFSLKAKPKWAHPLPCGSQWRPKPDDPLTKGQVEAAITEALTRFERDHLGRGPKQARSFIIQDMVLVRLTGILSPAEKQLSREAGGVQLLKQVRSRLIEGSSTTLWQIIEEATEAKVVTMHTDISSRTGERVFVFGLDENLDARFEDAE